MNYLLTAAVDYAVFVLETITVVAAIGLLVAWVASTVMQLRERRNESLRITHVNDRLDRMADRLTDALLNPAEIKDYRKRKKAEAKQRTKAEKLGKKHEPARLFVLDFDGDIRASPVDSLRESINALLQVVETDDEVMVRLESGGGMVHSYGLAASQLARLRDAGVYLTVSVDKVAASGGYMMACVAERIVAAPFAIIGSIGVVAQVPNFNRWLKDRDVDFEVFTAGEHKRTLTLFGENTDAGRSKFREELEDVHGLFKSFVARYRPAVDIDAVATGEHWHATQAQSLALVDEIATSDDVMLAAARADRSVFIVDTQQREPLLARLTGQAAHALARLGVSSKWALDSRRP